MEHRHIYEYSNMSMLSKVLEAKKEHTYFTSDFKRLNVQVLIFWEGHKILQLSDLWRFLKKIWSSQYIWTLNILKLELKPTQCLSHLSFVASSTLFCGINIKYFFCIFLFYLGFGKCLIDNWKITAFLRCFQKQW